MKKTLLILTGLVAGCASTLAQTVDGATQTTPPTGPGMPATFNEPAGLAYADTPARWEISFGGNGMVNKEFDASSGGFAVSVGQYVNPTLLASVRQSVNYVDNEDQAAAWAGSTRVALDHHFSQDRLRPFVGVSFGGVYGDTVRDSWAAGLEGGLKYYVLPRTFVQIGADYTWLFTDSDDFDDRFDDGFWNWSVAVGFNF